MSLRMDLLNRYTVSVTIKADERIRILIVDKHEAVRRALRIRLSVPTHLEVVGALPELDMALAQLPVLKPDIILLGLHNSTEEDRFKTTKTVSSIASETAVVIALAPYVDAVEREVFLQAGAKRYLLKHINSEQLIREIELCAPSMPAFH